MLASHVGSRLSSKGQHVSPVNHRRRQAPGSPSLEQEGGDGRGLTVLIEAAVVAAAVAVGLAQVAAVAAGRAVLVEAVPAPLW